VCVSFAASRVSVPQVARVLAEVYGDRMAGPAPGEAESFPLQQKLLVCCLLLLTRRSRSREVLLGKVHTVCLSVCLSVCLCLSLLMSAYCLSPLQLHEAYSRLCARRQVGGVAQMGGVAQGECLSLCSLLESRGIFALRKAKEARLTKVPALG